ncbi:MAG: hypothetical protein J6V90_11610 [Treponema sp.]|nr:hypothetical protein [Treponema sp.]
MADNQNSSDFGHKVIFLNPDFGGHGDVFKALREDEYELYFIENYRDAKSVLREFKDSICIVYADDNTNKRKMINFICSCAKDESLNSTIFYFLTSELAVKEKKALESAKPCYENMIKLNPRAPFLIQDIVRILEEKNAKGRRQYVRVSCADDRNATMLAEMDGRIYKFKMQDISVVGSACSVEEKLASVFPKGTVIPSVTICFDRKQLSIGEVAVYAVFSANGNAKLVLLFKNALAGENKAFVHKYIAEKFESAIHTIINTHPRDPEDYTKAFETGESDNQ